jgi:hypothetical protein
LIGWKEVDLGKLLGYFEDPTTLLVLILGVALTILSVYAVGQYRRDRRNAKRLAKFREGMIAAFRIPRLFGYDEGQCLLCRQRVDRNQSQAQVRLEGKRLRILSASNTYAAEIYFPPHGETQIAHLRCLPGITERRIEGMSEIRRFSSDMDKDDPSRYVVFHDFETEHYYQGFFPLGWRPGDKYPTVPFSITQPEILVEYLLAMATRRP